MRLGLAWNRGAPPPPLCAQLTDRLATIDHLFDPAWLGLGAGLGFGFGLGLAHPNLNPNPKPNPNPNPSPNPCSRGTRGDVLLVAFSAQGPGIQQWQAAAVAPLRALGASLDALYLADPSNSYYLQDPGGGWGGIAHFSELVRRESTPRYTHTHALVPRTIRMYGARSGAMARVSHPALTPWRRSLCLLGARQAPRANPNPNPSPLAPSP